VFAQPEVFIRFLLPQEENETVSVFESVKRVIGMMSTAFDARTFTRASCGYAPVAAAVVECSAWRGMGAGSSPKLGVAVVEA